MPEQSSHPPTPSPGPSWKPELNRAARPLYAALAKSLERDIREKRLLPGEKLPPQRELADYLGVNLSTVSKAFAECTRKGLIGATVGRGTFVSFDAGVDSMLIPTPQKEVVRMGSIFPEYTRNTELVTCLRAMLAEPEFGRLFHYGPADGTSWQKEAAAQLLRRAGHTALPEDILFANGGQNAIAAALAGLFKAGDKIGTDPLTYPGLKTAASMLGMQLVPIPQSGGEMSEEGLLHACKSENISGLFIIPDFHNPTTHTMSLEGRRMIAHTAAKRRLIVIEDAIHSLIHEQPHPPVASFAPDHVVHLASLSKAVSPGLRMAYITAPEGLKKRLSAALYNINIAVSPLMAELTARMILSGAAEAMINERRAYARAQNALVDTYLGSANVLGPPECFFRWLPLPGGMPGDVFERLAYRAGVQVYAAQRFAVGAAKPENAVRLAVTAPENAEELKRGLGILQGLLAEIHGPAPEHDGPIA